MNSKGKKIGYTSLAMITLISGMGATPSALASQTDRDVQTEQVEKVQPAPDKTADTLATKPEDAVEKPSEATSTESPVTPVADSVAVDSTSPDSSKPDQPKETVISETNTTTPTADITNAVTDKTVPAAKSAANDFGLKAAERVAAPMQQTTKAKTPKVDIEGLLNVTATPGSNQITLEWGGLSTSGISITSYTIQYQPTGAPWFTGPSVGALQTSETITSLTNGVQYNFQVQVNFSDGSSQMSSIVSATPAAVPSTPPLWAYSGDGEVNLAWSAPNDGGSPIIGYSVRYKSTDSSMWIPYPTDGTATSTTIDGLQNGQMYNFQVAAINASGIGSYGSATATPISVPDTPVLTPIPGDGQVKLTWTVPDDGGAPITGYTLRYKPTDSDDTAWVTYPTDGTATTATIDGLTNGQSYDFEIAAINYLGAGAYGSTQAIPAALPAAPELTPTRGDGQVELTWTVPDDDGSPITGYALRYKPTDSDDTAWVTYPTDGTATAVTIDGLTNGQSYDFEVAAINAIGTGAYGSNTAIPATVPAAPVLTPTPGDTQVDISWTMPDDNGSPIVGFILQYKLTTEDNWITVPTVDTDLTATITGLTNGLDYDFRVAAINEIGTGNYGEATTTPNKAADNTEDNTGGDNTGNNTTPPTDVTPTVPGNTTPATPQPGESQLPSTGGSTTPTPDKTGNDSQSGKTPSTPVPGHLPGTGTGGTPAKVGNNTRTSNATTPTQTANQKLLPKSGRAFGANQLLIIIGSTLLGLIGAFGLLYRKRR
ncbi:hypothetical protein EQG49_08160 [Periweissella cryptocerci]|uniref:Fibronectin type III domain-containing protein n=1 Tax=Periweissella cryptocerci TaxID=2506420 RepID=A0A4P6YUQ0_9LACO|nr:fibronectin type III domain-containing protein [Periweissella cryptocerci]QBO36443.1 hypothetical protein EQG49_08160 [Periweissella cryptocerci]